MIRPDIMAGARAVRRAQEEAGYDISDDEFDDLVEYAERKRTLTGKEPEYLLLLLEDEIRDKWYRDVINAAAALKATPA